MAAAARGVRLIALAWALAGAAAQAQTPAPVRPQAAPKPAEPGAIKGTTRCAADLGLGLPVTGRIAHMPVQEGSAVRAGDVLLRLDQSAEQFDVERRRVQWQGQAELELARVRVETSRSQAQAARTIYQSSQGISREELENRELAYATATAELQRLRNQKEIEHLDYLTARENLERRTLRAPTRGIVTRLVKQAGESVQANETAIKMCDLSKILFVANVPSELSEHLHAGNAVNLEVGAKAAAVRGRLTFVSPVVDAASGLREVKIELINPGPDVRPGVPATLELKPR